MVAIDPRTGDIRALVGGRRYERGGFNRALLAHRQPGSAFKPFVYAAALAAGYTPATEVDDEPVEVRIGRTIWSPKNYGGEYGGRITLRRALMRSANAATVRVSQLVGIPAILATAHKFGITSQLPDVPSAALGALEVTPLELVAAYAPFANGGWRVTPRLVRRITTADGTLLWSSDNSAQSRDGSARRVSAHVDAARRRELRHGQRRARPRRRRARRRKDRHDERRHQRLVRGLHADARRRFLVRLRSAALHQRRCVGRTISPHRRGRTSISLVGPKRRCRRAWDPPAGHDARDDRCAHRLSRDRVVPAHAEGLLQARHRADRAVLRYTGEPPRADRHYARRHHAAPDVVQQIGRRDRRVLEAHVQDSRTDATNGRSSRPAVRQIRRRVRYTRSEPVALVAIEAREDLLDA